jgi:hypothetical protein
MFWYLLFFLALVYEFVYINEDLLFIISFVIFFVNIVNAVSEFLSNELNARRAQLAELVRFNVLLNKYVLSSNSAIFDFLDSQDLEKEVGQALYFSNNSSNDFLELDSINFDVDYVENLGFLVSETEELTDVEVNSLNALE